MLSYDELNTTRNEDGIIPNFSEIIKKDLEIEDNPKADTLIRIAWDLGHSSGYYDVYLYALDLVELIK